MSDSVKKWYDMQDDNQDSKVSYIFESPDRGKTIYRREFGTTERELVDNTPMFEVKLTEEEVKEAYKVLAYYEKNVILYAAKILNDEGTL